MCTIAEAFQIWNSLDFDSILDESIKDNEAEIIDEQVDQMKHGLKSDGSLIGTYATLPSGELSDYAKMKNLQNSLPGAGNVDLILFSDFTENIILQYEKDSIRLISTDEKNEKLTTGQMGYGANVFGLMLERLDVINQESILPSLLKNLRIATHL